MSRKLNLDVCAKGPAIVAGALAARMGMHARTCECVIATCSGVAFAFENVSAGPPLHFLALPEPGAFDVQPVPVPPRGASVVPADADVGAWPEPEASGVVPFVPEAESAVRAIPGDEEESA